MHGDAIKDARGLPPNIEQPNNGWRRGSLPCDHGHRLYANVFRQRYADIKPAFAGGAFIHKWWSWQIMVCFNGRTYYLVRWRERWAV